MLLNITENSDLFGGKMSHKAIMNKQEQRWLKLEMDYKQEI